MSSTNFLQSPVYEELPSISSQLLAPPLTFAYSPALPVKGLQPLVASQSQQEGTL